MEQNRAWKELPACISKGTGYPYAKKRAIQTIHKNELEMTTDLNNPLDYNPPGSSGYGISQAGVVEWVAIFFSRRCSWCRDRTQVFCTAHRFLSEPPGKGFPGGLSGKEPTCQLRRHKRRGFNSWVGKIPWRRVWQPTPVFLLREAPWTEEPGRLQFIGSQWVGHD